MKLLLTSTGLENPALRRAFVRLLPCETARARALFIPTAAVNCDAIEVLPKCLEDLYGIGIRRENIVVYDLHEPMTEAEIAAYDCVYLCGGDTKYLAKRVKEARFGAVLRAYLAAGRGGCAGRERGQHDLLRGAGCGHRSAAAGAAGALSAGVCGRRFAPG